MPIIKSLSTSGDKINLSYSPDNYTPVIESGITTGINQLSSHLKGIDNRLAGYINVKEYGAIGDGIIDDTIAIQNAINSLNTDTGGVVYIPPGTYKVTSSITVSKLYVHILGAGIGSTTINFNPSTSAIAFNFFPPYPGTYMIPLSSIRGLALTGQGTYQKIGISFTDVDVFDISDVYIKSWTSSLHDSIGIQCRGRDMVSIQSIKVYADLPISIEGNPYYWIDSDHFCIRNTYLVTQVSTGSAVRIKAGVNITNLTFEGYNAWCLGSYGLLWNVADITTNATFNILSVSESGAITGLSIVNSGAGYSTGIDIGISATNTSWAYVRIDSVDSNGSILTYTLSSVGSGYTTGVKSTVPYWTSYSVNLSNIRHEQAENSSGYSFFINAKCHNLLLRNCGLAIDCNGIYGRYIDRLSIENCRHISNTNSPINIDSTCGTVLVQNCFIMNPLGISAVGLTKDMSYSNIYSYKVT